MLPCGKLIFSRTLLYLVVNDQVTEGQGRHGRHGRGGPGRGGAELLARPRPGQERVDTRDGHPVTVDHVAGRGAHQP